MIDARAVSRPAIFNPLPPDSKPSFSAKTGNELLRDPFGPSAGLYSLVAM